MLTGLLRRLAQKLDSWAFGLPDAPFEGELTTAALVIVAASYNALAAEINVPLDKIESYFSGVYDALSKAEQQRLKAFFARRGFHELPITPLFGCHVFIWWPAVYSRHRVRLDDQLRTAARIQQIRDAGWRE